VSGRAVLGFAVGALLGAWLQTFISTQYFDGHSILFGRAALKEPSDAE
jgi:hypothetical protein